MSLIYSVGAYRGLTVVSQSLCMCACTCDTHVCVCDIHVCVGVYLWVYVQRVDVNIFFL